VKRNQEQERKGGSGVATHIKAQWIVFFQPTHW